MRIYILAASVLALAACDAAPPPQNAVIEDVAANNMIADDVTEVQDDSASAPSEDVAEPTETSNADQTDEEASPSGNSRDKR